LGIAISCSVFAPACDKVLAPRASMMSRNQKLSQSLG
jgi:hypothetical protein